MISSKKLEIHFFRSNVLAAFVPAVVAQLDAFALPQVPRYAPKPTVPPELRSYFELDGHARELMDSLLGPRPGGLFPEKTYEIGSSDAGPAGPVHVPSNLERTLESFFTAPENPSGAFPPGFGGGGFSLQNNQQTLASAGNVRRAPSKKDDEIEGSGFEEKSSIAGIPKMPLTKIPTPPLSDIENLLHPQRRVASQLPLTPAIRTAPDVPEGGLLPADVRRAPQSVSEVASSIDDAPQGVNTEEYGGLSEETSTSSGGLIGTILNLIQLGSKKASEAAKSNQTATGKPEDRNALGKAVSNLIGGENSPLPGKSMISNVLYKALTAGTVQNNETSTNENTTFVLSPAQSAAIGENLEMVKNLIIQETPICTQKIETVNFDIDSLMGQWYQVIYSPVSSSGPCSMLGYKKLSSVNDGGVGSIFEVFEYTTDGTPYGKPKITSGYAMLKQPGELIYRTTSNQDDVDVRILHLGPVNAQNKYEYVVISANCNYPIYVFARDPVTFKQKYEAEVNKFLESKGLVNGFSRLLNIVSPVDNSMCTFPPSLFNMAG